MKKNNLAALAACALLCFLVLSLMLVIFSARHDCSGAGCHICTAAHSFGSWLRGLTATVLLISRAGCAVRRTAVRKDIAAPRGFSFTPVSLRVKLAN